MKSSLSWKPEVLKCLFLQLIIRQKAHTQQNKSKSNHFYIFCFKKLDFISDLMKLLFNHWIPTCSIDSSSSAVHLILNWQAQNNRATKQKALRSPLMPMTCQSRLQPVSSYITYELSAEWPSQVTITCYDMPTAQTDCKALEPYCVNTERMMF